jgi:hypothetical protein
MENKPNQIESLFEKATDYLELRLELAKLKTAEKSSDILSTIISGIILIAIFSSFLIMINIGIALFLGELFGKNYFGFFALAGFYALAAIIFYVYKNVWIKKPVSNMIIKKMSL